MARLYRYQRLGRQIAEPLCVTAIARGSCRRGASHLSGPRGVHRAGPASLGKLLHQVLNVPREESLDKP